MTSFIISLAIRLTVLLVVGGIAVLIARRWTSATRHIVIAATLACVIALPLMMLLVPEWRVAVLPSPEPAPTPAMATAPSAAAAPTPSQQAPTIHPVLVTASHDLAPLAAPAPVLSPARTLTLPEAALGVWLLGVMVGLLWFAVGRMGLARVRRRATPLLTAEWRELLDTERAHAGVARDVTLLASEMVSTPVTWGVLAPVIVLPEKALVWSDERRRVVLMHELAHIARRDSGTQLVATLASIVYWVHPLVLLAARRLRAECERACDERVLELGTPATDYAAHLLDVARFARSFGASSIVSVAMARPSQLEGRLLAVLRASPRRERASARSRVAGTLFAASALVAVSAFRPVARDAALRSPDLATRPRVNGEISRLPVDLERPAPAPVAKAKAMPMVKAARLLRDSTFEKKVAVHSGGTLELDLDTGADVKIIGWDEPSVSVSGTIGGLSWKGTTVTLDASGDDARLVTRYEGSSNNESFDNSFVIHVPKKYNVRVRSAGGGVSIDGVDGSFMGHTGGGEIRIANANGDADLTTGGGDVRISRSHLDGAVHTGGGNMEFTDVTGSVVDASGSYARKMRNFAYKFRDFRMPPMMLHMDSATMMVGKMDTMHFKMDSAAFKMDSMSFKMDTVWMKGAQEAMVRARVTIEKNRDAMKRARVMIETEPGMMEDMPMVWMNDGDGKMKRRERVVVIDKDGGDIKLSDVPDGAHVTTGGGTIVIGRSTGRVMAHTGGGNVTIDAAEGAASVVTGAGDVTIVTAGKEAHAVDVRSGTGGVTVRLPRDANVTLDLETAYTREDKPSKIISDWPVTPTTTSDWDDSHGTPRKFVRVRQDIGKGGPVIRVHTVNGDIQIRKEK